MTKAHSKWIVPTRIQRQHFRCPECRSCHVLADEDGCCATCGADCIVENCYCSKRDRRRKEAFVTSERQQPK
jgi:hypothetical protein